MFGDLRNECSEDWSKYLWNIASYSSSCATPTVLYSLQIVVFVVDVAWLSLARSQKTTNIKR